MLRRLTDSLKVEKRSDVHWFSRINLTLFGAIKNSISRLYLQYYKLLNISTFVIAKECMCFPNRIRSPLNFKSIINYVRFLHHVEWFAIEGGTTRGNAWEVVSFASGIGTPTSFLPHGLHCFSTNTLNHSKV